MDTLQWFHIERLSFRSKLNMFNIQMSKMTLAPANQQNGKHVILFQSKEAFMHPIQKSGLIQTLLSKALPEVWILTQKLLPKLTITERIQYQNLILSSFSS